MSTNTARKIEMPSAEEMVGSPSLKATEDFVNSRALEILREWAMSPEVVEIMDEAARAEDADAAAEG